MTGMSPAMTQQTSQPATWDEYHRKMALIAYKVLGAAKYFDDEPEHATDERLAACFRHYVEQFRAIEYPADR